MASKVSKPYYSPTRNNGAWYFKIDGKPKLLGKHPNASKPDSSKPPKSITDEWLRQVTMSTQEVKTDYRFAELVGIYLESNPSNDVESILTRLCEFQPGGKGKRIGDMLVNAELEPGHVEAWLDQHDTTAKPWSAATKASYAAQAKAVINWCMKKKKAIAAVVRSNPLKGVELDTPMPRDSFVTEEDHRSLLLYWGVREKNFDSGFCDLLRALWNTGARPGEIYKLTSEHVDLTHGVIVLDEHKTGKRTGQRRLIPINDELRAILVRRIEQHPSGPLFRGAFGQQFTTQSVYNRFASAQADGIIAEDIVPYSYRHGFATEALSNSVDLYDVAKILGHKQIGTTSRQYDKSRRNVAHLTEIANRVRAPKPK